MKPLHQPRPSDSQLLALLGDGLPEGSPAPRPARADERLRSFRERQRRESSARSGSRQGAALSPPRAAASARLAAGGPEAAAEARLLQLRQTCARLERDCALRDGELTVAQADLVMTETELSSVKAELADVSEEKKALERSVAEQSERLRAQDGTIAALRRQLEASDGRAEAMRADLERMQLEIEQMRTEAIANLDEQARVMSGVHATEAELVREAQVARDEADALREQLAELWATSPERATSGVKCVSPPPVRHVSVPLPDIAVAGPLPTLDTADEWVEGDAGGANLAAALDSDAPDWHPSRLYGGRAAPRLPKWHPHRLRAPPVSTPLAAALESAGADGNQRALCRALGSVWRVDAAAALEYAAGRALLVRAWRKLWTLRQRKLRGAAVSRTLAASAAAAVLRLCWSRLCMHRARARNRVSIVVCNQLRLLRESAEQAMRMRAFTAVRLRCLRRRMQRRTAASMAAASDRTLLRLLFLQWPVRPESKLALNDDAALPPAARLVRALRREKRALRQGSSKQHTNVLSVSLDRLSHLPRELDGTAVSVQGSGHSGESVEVVSSKVDMGAASLDGPPLTISLPTDQKLVPVRVVVPSVGAAVGHLKAAASTATLRLLRRPGFDEGDPCATRGFVHVSTELSEQDCDADDIDASFRGWQSFASDRRPPPPDEARLSTDERLERVLQRERLRQNWRLVLTVHRADKLPLTSEGLGLQVTMSVAGSEETKSTTVVSVGGCRVYWGETFDLISKGGTDVHCRLAIAGIGAAEVSFTPSRLPPDEWVMPLFPGPGDELGASAVTFSKLFVSVANRQPEEMALEEPRAPCIDEKLDVPFRVPAELEDDSALGSPERLHRAMQRLALKGDWEEEPPGGVYAPDEWDAERESLSLSRRPSHLPDEFDPDAGPERPEQLTTEARLQRALSRERELCAEGLLPVRSHGDWVVLSLLRVEGLSAAGGQQVSVRARCLAQPARTSAVATASGGICYFSDSFAFDLPHSVPSSLHFELLLGGVLSGSCRLTLPPAPEPYAAATAGEVRLPLIPASPDDAVHSMTVSVAGNLVLRFASSSELRKVAVGIDAAVPAQGRRGSAERLVERLCGELDRRVGDGTSAAVRRADDIARKLRLHGGVFTDGGFLNEGLLEPVQCSPVRKRRPLVRPSRKQPTRLGSSSGPGKPLAALGARECLSDEELGASSCTRTDTADVGFAGTLNTVRDGDEDSTASPVSAACWSPVAAAAGDPVARPPTRLRSAPRCRTQKPLQLGAQGGLETPLAPSSFPQQPWHAPSTPNRREQDLAAPDRTYSTTGFSDALSVARQVSNRRSRPAPKPLQQAMPSSPLLPSDSRGDLTEDLQQSPARHESCEWSFREPTGQFRPEDVLPLEASKHSSTDPAVVYQVRVSECLSGHVDFRRLRAAWDLLRLRQRAGRVRGLLKPRASAAERRQARLIRTVAVSKWLAWLCGRKRQAPSEFVVVASPTTGFQNVAWRRTPNADDRVDRSEQPWARAGDVVAGVSVGGGWVRSTETGLYLPSQWLSDTRSDPERLCAGADAASVIERMNKPRLTKLLLNEGAAGDGSFLNGGCLLAATDEEPPRPRSPRNRADALGAPGAIWRRREADLVKAASDAQETLERDREQSVQLLLQEVRDAQEVSTQTLPPCPTLSSPDSGAGSRCSTPRDRPSRLGFNVAPGWRAAESSHLVSDDSAASTPRSGALTPGRDRALAAAPGAVWQHREKQLISARDEAYRACAEAERAARLAEEEGQKALAKLEARAGVAVGTQAEPETEAAGMQCVAETADVGVSAEGDVLSELVEAERLRRIAVADLKTARAELEEAIVQRNAANEMALSLCADIASAEAHRQDAERRLRKASVEPTEVAAYLGQLQNRRLGSPPPPEVAAPPTPTPSAKARRLAVAAACAAAADRRLRGSAFFRWVCAVTVRAPVTEWIVDPPAGHQSVMWRRAPRIDDTVMGGYSVSRGTVVRGKELKDWLLETSTHRYLPKCWLLSAAAAASQRLSSAEAEVARLREQVRDAEQSLADARGKHQQCVLELSAVRERAKLLADAASRRSDEAGVGPLTDVEIAYRECAAVAKSAMSEEELSAAQERVADLVKRRKKLQRDAEKGSDPDVRARAGKAADSLARRIGVEEEALEEQKAAVKKRDDAVLKLGEALRSDPMLAEAFRRPGGSPPPSPLRSPVNFLLGRMRRPSVDSR
eukprot:TRINITY_DN40041_c0_g1_i1.p1 TRINITY_DN40041_c0_g1~~TRINITY_DN40041_c0_g1_i1.p1  ORF type:complete len:2206 (+),score=680.67 TRINITY_DN40041_c0_g1_i1:68-6685(+)